MSDQPIEKVQVVLPEEDFVFVEFTQEEQPGLAHINQAIKAFVETDGKKAFPWHLSLIMVYKDHIDDKLPTKEEHELLVEFQKTLDGALKQQGNALFLASITHNGYRELIWRIHNPYPANDLIHDLIEAEDHPHPFDFTLEEDKEWNAAKWHLDALDTKAPEKKSIPGKYWE